MNLNYIFSLAAVVVLGLVVFALASIPPLQMIFGIVIPYAAFLIFIVMMIRRVWGWGRSAVPFRIPTTCGQQKSLPWIKSAAIDNPFTKIGVVLRMLIEVLLFRSLFRNTKAALTTTANGPRISFYLEIWLWLFALVFHYAFLTVTIRHLRFFTEPVFFPVKILEALDGFFQVGQPVIYLSGLALLGAVLFLLARRILIPQLRYISLASDYFPLFLIIGIAFTGVMMRYFAKVDVVGIKTLTMGLATIRPTIPEGIDALFFVHLFFVCLLVAYIPFSKITHMAGVFMSPTRNMVSNNRAVRHVNPWNYPVKIHTYEAYEDDFREKMEEAGLPVEKRSSECQKS